MMIGGVALMVTRPRVRSHPASRAMTKALRKVLVLLTIGAFVVPSLLGTALHCIPGFQHGLFRCDGCHDGADEAAHGCADGAAHGCADRAAHGCADGADHSAAEHHHQPGVSSANGSLTDDGHSCPICSFLASGKLFQATAVVFSATAVLAMVVPVDRFFVPRWELRPFGPRGPPSF